MGSELLAQTGDKSPSQTIKFVAPFPAGGTTDIVTSPEVGVLFDHQTVDDVARAIELAEQRTYFPSKLNRTAKRFDKSLFITKLRKIVSNNSPR